MDNFPEETTRELVQWLEDVGHGSRAHDPALHWQITRRVSEFIDAVLGWHGLSVGSRDVSISTDARNGSMVIKVSITAKDAAYLEQHDPALYRVLAHDPDICVCQTLDGIRHTH